MEGLQKLKCGGVGVDISAGNYRVNPARRLHHAAAMDQQAEELKARTRRFAMRVLDLSESVPAMGAGYELRRQLIRAALGTAGNYRSACRARSHAEFTARLGIVLEEVDESELWLDILDERNLGTEPLRKALLAESREL